MKCEEIEILLVEDNPDDLELALHALKKGNLRQAIEYTNQALKVRNAWLEAHHIDPAKLKLKL